MKIYLKKPCGRRKSYALYKRETTSDGKTRNETLLVPELEIINHNLAILSPEAALNNALEVKRKIERKFGIGKAVVIHNEDNQRIFAKYWEKYKRRDLIDPNTARYQFERALRALGNLPLLTATQEEIEDKIKSQDMNRNKKRLILRTLKMLLKFLGREVEFRLPREEVESVAYLSENDFLDKLKKVEEPHLKSLFYVLFYTGMRLGEAFALSEMKLRPAQQIVVVDRQVDKNGKTRLPKWEKTRRAFVRAKAFPTIKEWLILKDTFPYSRLSTNKRFKKYFGKDLTIHDLRHSYAISLLAKGVSMAHVAQSLGNSVKVCEKYYTGFELVDESIELMRKIVGD